MAPIDRFKADTDVTADYSEDFNDNNEVYAKYFEPYLGTGKTMDFDIVCPTYWMAAWLARTSAGSSRCRST